MHRIEHVGMDVKGSRAGLLSLRMQKALPLVFQSCVGPVILSPR